MIDRDTIIDYVAAVDTEFEKLEVGTYNGFDLYERFAMYVEAKVRAEEREACIKLLEDFSKTTMVPVKDTWRMGLIAGANALRERGQS